MSPNARARVGDIAEELGHLAADAGELDLTRVRGLALELQAIAGAGPPARALMGTSDIAAYYGIRRQLAAKWIDRSDFPAPLDELASGRVWDAAAVRAWGERRGKREGGGPGEPRRPAGTG